jgi:SAM-dependent methyltransferase
MAENKPQLDWDRVRKFYGQVSFDIGSAMLGAMSYIGDRLGIFTSLADAGAVTCEELAARTGLSERYLREWLSAMTAAQYVRYDPAERKYSMPPEHAMVLAREESPFFSGGFIQSIVPNLSVTPKIMDAFRTGRGVAQSEYPPETFESMERASSGLYRHQLIRKWLPAMPQVTGALDSGGAYLDAGCGCGRAVIAVAAAFAKAQVFGFDAHAASIERARNNARAAGLADRITLEVVDCVNLPAEKFDFISTFDVVHDSVDPVALLRSIRHALRSGGTFLMVEVNVSSRLEDNISTLGRMMYSMSTLYCLSVSLGGGGVGIGACMGEDKAREIAREAGFAQFRRLPIEDMFSALYELRP